jgi:hypothetical protein
MTTVGTRDALEAVYRTEARRVLATLIRLLGGFEAAEEALHEAFAVAAERWPRDGTPANPYAWRLHWTVQDHAPSVYSPHLTTPPSRARNTPCVGAKHAVFNDRSVREASERSRPQIIKTHCTTGCLAAAATGVLSGGCPPNGKGPIRGPSSLRPAGAGRSRSRDAAAPLAERLWACSYPAGQ